MTLAWKASFETGVEDIDLQHHYFVNLVNRIRSDLCSTTDPEYRERLVNELINYAHFHFVSEENIAQANGFLTELDHHRQRHTELLIQLRQQATDMLDGANTPEDFLEFLYGWFTGHTLNEDRKFFTNK
jgi:hemerythrin-like metal-binding protein